MIILLSWGEETRIKGKNCRVVTELNGEMKRNENMFILWWDFQALNKEHE